MKLTSMLWQATLAIGCLSPLLLADEHAISLPHGGRLVDVEFDRHVVPLLSRFGCNAGSCHGSFQGRGGMRLSLFGHSPAMDHDALVERIDDSAPAESLVLLKPTGETAHEGGTRFEKGDWPYRVIERWIELGASRDNESQPVSLSVQPDRIAFDAVGDRASVRVLASFPDDSQEDVTAFCRFTSRDAGIVTVDDDGNLQARRAGASHITVEYRGSFASVLTSTPFSAATTETYNKANFTDDFINAKLRELSVTPSALAGDDEFLRRLTLDTVGRLPTVDEIRRFRNSSSVDRRERQIERLLHDRRHASLWATRFCDMTRCTAELMEAPETLKAKRARMWHEWFRYRIEHNVAYDQIVRGVLCGTSRGSQETEAWIDEEAQLIRELRAGYSDRYRERDFLDLFWRRVGEGGNYPRKEIAEVTSAAFLGVQIECAACHKHPYDVWTQADYGAYVNVFSEVAFGSSTTLNRAVLRRLQRRRDDAASGEVTPPLPRLAEVYNSAELARPIVNHRDGQAITPRPLGGEAIAGQTDPRAGLMDWMVGEGRQQFARNFVNRVWAHYFGRGIVDPVDGFSAINTPSHPRLLDRLAREFIRAEYDIRWLERTILSSHAYQRSAEFQGNNSLDDRHYARAYVRPLLAEVSVDVIHQAIGIPVDASDDLPAGSTVIELASDRPGNPRLARMLQTFGRGPRATACDCDRQPEPSLRKSLFLMSDEKLLQAIPAGRLMQQVLQCETRDDAIELAFLSVLSRSPHEGERAAAREHFEVAVDEQAAWKDMIWALINTREFLTNH